MCGLVLQKAITRLVRFLIRYCDSRPHDDHVPYDSLSNIIAKLIGPVIVSPWVNAIIAYPNQ